MNNETTPVFPEEAAQQLQSLAERSQQIREESEKWFIKYANPLFDQCQTMEDWKKVRMAMPSPMDKERQGLDLPGNMQVYLAYTADAVRQKLEGSK